MIKFATYICFLLLIISSSFSPDARAQIPPEPVGADSVQTALLPIAGYDSDIGLLGGVLYNRIDYSGNIQPFNYYLNSSLTASTRGMFSLIVMYDRINSFNGRIRSKIDLTAYRFLHDYYFGTGNNTGFSQKDFSNNFYFFESLGFSLDYEGRIPLYHNSDSGLELVFGFGTRFENPSADRDSSMFGFDRPAGFKGGWVNALKTGLIRENRSSEFDPTSGSRFELYLRIAPESIINDFGLVTVEADYRKYFRIFNLFNLANRLQFRYAGGTVPYWELSGLGSEETLRGYPLNRFLGNSSVAYTMELRKWLIAFPDYSIKIGAHLFTDIGRVFTEENVPGDLLKDYKQTFGLGGAISLFSPDFLFRGEAGFSEDMMRIYVGIGYTF